MKDFIKVAIFSKEEKKEVDSLLAGLSEADGYYYMQAVDMGDSIVVAWSKKIFTRDDVIDLVKEYQVS